MNDVPAGLRSASDDVLSVIVGPTAAGKSTLALRLAHEFGLAIISADSRQVYRHFDIGTAKPTLDERRTIPHYGIDVVEPTARYSAHAWAGAADTWMTTARACGTAPVIVGGTGLYIRALVEPLAPVPSLDPVGRTALEPWFASQPLEDLQRWCARLDPLRAHLGRTQLQRAIETALLAGVRLSDAWPSADIRPAGRPVRYLLIDPGPVLVERIAARVAHMVRAGFVDEVRQLMATVPDDAPAWNASGYRVLREALQGRRTQTEALERVIIETRQYAKRQRTWFRHQVPVHTVTTVNPDAPDAWEQVCAWWTSSAPPPTSSRSPA